MIAKISLWVYNFSSSTVKQIIPPKSLLNKDFYLTHVNWVKEDRLTVIWTLKNQNNSIISSCFESKEWNCEEVCYYSHTFFKLIKSFGEQ